MKIHKVKIWGDRALFNQPHLAAGPHSYPCITPSAARRLLCNLYWKPEFEWVIRRISILSPPKYETVSRQVFADKKGTGNTTLQVQTELVNPAYLVEAIAFPNPLRPGYSQAKFDGEITRRLSQGQEYRVPFLGRTEYPAKWEYLTERLPKPVPYTDEFKMLFDLAPPDADAPAVGGTNSGDMSGWIPLFFKAKFVDGVLEIPPYLYDEYLSLIFSYRNNCYQRSGDAVS